MDHLCQRIRIRMMQSNLRLKTVVTLQEAAMHWRSGYVGDSVRIPRELFCVMLTHLPEAYQRFFTNDNLDKPITEFGALLRNSWVSYIGRSPFVKDLKTGRDYKAFFDNPDLLIGHLIKIRDVAENFGVPKTLVQILEEGQKSYPSDTIRWVKTVDQALVNMKIKEPLVHPLLEEKKPEKAPTPEKADPDDAAERALAEALRQKVIQAMEHVNIPTGSYRSPSANYDDTIQPVQITQVSASQDQQF